MTAPLCHGTAGGCHYALGATQPHHTDDCPTMQERLTPPTSQCAQCRQDVGVVAGMFADHAMSQWDRRRCPASGAHVRPTKRTIGQCRCAYERYPDNPMADPLTTHRPDCPTLYPLQRQPGDEKDALTRLTAHVRSFAQRADLIAPSHGDAQTFEHAALDLISEAREEHKAADAQRASEWQQERTGRNALGERVLDLEQQRDTFAADLAKAKEMVRTLTLQQTEVRQRAFLDMAGELLDMDPVDRYVHLCNILEVAKGADS